MPFSDYTLIGPLTYRGKEGCDNVTCTRSSEVTTHCYGWHCAYCDEPCSYQGHRCDAAEAVLGASRAALGIPEPDDHRGEA